jgi:hypothetical protein
MAFARIRSLRARRSTPPSPAVTAAKDADIAEDFDSCIGKTTDHPTEITVQIDEDLPIKEIAIDPQSSSINEVDASTPELWNIPSLNPMCSCGLTNLLCLTDGLCGIIPPPPPLAATPNKVASPYFLKVEKTNKCTTPSPRDTGDCSTSRAADGLEESETKVVVKQDVVNQVEQCEKDKGADGKSKRVETVRSLHLQVGPLETREKSDNSGQNNECKQQQQQVDSPEFVTEERIRLPIRAGRNVRKQSPVAMNYRQPTLPSARNGLSRLPARAGRRNKTQEDTITETNPHEKSSQHRRFAERRRALIAATKKEEPILPSRDEPFIDIPLIDISHTVSFENEEIIETMVVSKVESTHCHHDELCRGESNATKGSSVDCTNETLEETFEETIDYDTDDSELDFEKQDNDRITKAGWITRQLHREARRDRIEGIQSVELVYTLD